MPSLQQIIGSGKAWQMRHNRRDSRPERPISSGFAALNRHLPGGGLPGRVCAIYAARVDISQHSVMPPGEEKQVRWSLMEGLNSGHCSAVSVGRQQSSQPVLAVAATAV